MTSFIVLWFFRLKVAAVDWPGPSRDLYLSPTVAGSGPVRNCTIRSRNGTWPYPFIGIYGQATVPQRSRYGQGPYILMKGPATVTVNLRQRRLIEKKHSTVKPCSVIYGLNNIDTLLTRSLEYSRGQFYAKSWTGLVSSWTSLASSGTLKKKYPGP